MAEKTKACPQCGTTMGFRLGMYECPQCGHEEEGEKKPEVKIAESSGPGFRKEAWQRPPTSATGSGQPGQPPPPQSFGTLYTPGAAPPPGLYGGPEASHDAYPSLQVEKTVFFALQVLSHVVMLIFLIVGASMAGAAPDLGVNVGMMIFSYLISSAISLGLYWFVLFGEQIWAKYTCAGCNLLILLFLVPTMFFATPNDYAMQQARPFILLTSFIWLAYVLWLISILWRDARRLQGN